MIKKIIPLIIIYIFLGTEANAQVPKYRKIKSIGKKGFNYSENKDKKYRKDKTLRVVYSDRENNVSYANAYFQYKLKEQKMLSAYYVIGDKNNAFELVVANAEEVGKPKGLFAPMVKRRNHFIDAKSVSYVGWIPKDNLILYNHSFLAPHNNVPIKYKVAFDKIDELSNISQYFKEDTVYLFSDPYLKKKSPYKVFLNQIVYPYKYNGEENAVFVSTSPYLKDTTAQQSGWIRTSLITPIGADNYVCDINNRDIEVIYNPDTLLIHQKEVVSDFLYTSPLSKSKNHQNKDISIPVWVWDYYNNKIMNVNGENVLATEIDRIINESKDVNINIIFNMDNLPLLQTKLNSLQNIWLLALKYSNYTYKFSTIGMGFGMNYYVPPTTSFSEWLSNTFNIIEEKTADTYQTEEHVKDLIYQSINANQDKSMHFQNNIFIIFGDNESLSFIDEELLDKMEQHSSKLLFVQVENKANQSYQSFILRAKELSDEASIIYSQKIKNYIADNKLVPLVNRLKALDEESVDNVYLYDAPDKSLYNGGVLFPKVGTELSSISIDQSLDSLMNNIIKTNDKLITSLNEYRVKLGILRSKPNSILKTVSLKDSMPNDISNIDQISPNEVYFLHAKVPDSLLNEFESGYLLEKEELMALIEHYRALLPLFKKKMSFKDKCYVKKLYRRQKRSVNKRFGHRVLSRRSSIASLFYYNTNVVVSDSFFNKMSIANTFNREMPSFERHYKDAVLKVNMLENLFLNDKLRVVSDVNNKKLYYIPKEQLL